MQVTGMALIMVRIWVYVNEMWQKSHHFKYAWHCLVQSAGLRQAEKVFGIHKAKSLTASEPQGCLQAWRISYIWSEPQGLWSLAVSGFLFFLFFFLLLGINFFIIRAFILNSSFRSASSFPTLPASILLVSQGGLWVDRGLHKKQEYI